MDRKIIEKKNDPNAGRKKPFGWWAKERKDVKPLNSPQISPRQHKNIAGKRVARALLNYVRVADKDKLAEVHILDLTPYGEKIVEQFVKDFKIKVPKQDPVPTEPGTSEKKDKKAKKSDS